jgi:hypothetical protein
MWEKLYLWENNVSLLTWILGNAFIELLQEALFLQRSGKAMITNKTVRARSVAARRANREHSL